MARGRQSRNALNEAHKVARRWRGGDGEASLMCSDYEQDGEAPIVADIFGCPKAAARDLLQCAHKRRWGNPGAAVRREPSKMKSCRSLCVSDILL